MNSPRFFCWKDGGPWLGYLEEFPDYLTQGESLDDLKGHLKDLQVDLTGGQIPAVRRVGELEQCIPRLPTREGARPTGKREIGQSR